MAAGDLESGLIKYSLVIAGIQQPGRFREAAGAHELLTFPGFNKEKERV